MAYISSVSGESTNIKDMVLATNPLLESFGCAKTLKNNNSSRHGKYLELIFNRSLPIGAHITNYLLEKGRVVSQSKNERNFHIFYQITKANHKYKETFGLIEPQNYTYLAQNGCLDVDGIDDVIDYNETINAMDKIGINEMEKENIHRVLSSILWLGNIELVENENSTDNGSQIQNEELLEYTAYVLETEKDELRKALTIRTMETSRGSRRGSFYEVPLNEPQAVATRNALSKFLYEKLFEWIITRLNMALNPTDNNINHKVIGILDIYGFEIFKNNSFEQLCINYVNEKLQQIFIDLTLKREQEEYKNENIEWTPISFFNNKIVCDLIEEKRPPGVFSTMNDACATAHADPKAADNTLSQRLQALTSNPHFSSRGNGFVLKHYAGDVSYNIVGMTEKNKDQLNKDLIQLTQKSKNKFIRDLFNKEETETSNNKKRPPTASDRIKNSAHKLTEKLTLSSSPSYIRCIKSNDKKKPLDYDEEMCLHQIKYLGLYENVRVRRAGFAFRQTYKGFLERFFLLSENTSKSGELTWNGDPKSGTITILKDANINKSSYQQGTTKIFIKEPEILFQLEHLREEYWHKKARIIQQYYKKNKSKLKGYVLKQKAQNILNNKKERRRFSLLSQRTFVGNYLNITSSSHISTIANIQYNEVTVFSAKIQTLVPRPLRSSKLMSRILIITNEKITILQTEKTDKKLKIEKQLSISEIQKITASTLRDDWIIIGLNNDIDVLICSIFKTEIITHLVELNKNITFNTSDNIQYTKKQNKKVVIKFVKDSTLKQDIYKSHTVYVAGDGIPKDSELKNLKPKTSKKTFETKNNKTQNSSINDFRANPIIPKESNNSELYEAIYDFQCNSEHGMDLKIDESFEITTKETNGWWYAKNTETGKEGWVPSNYLKLKEKKTPSTSYQREIPNIKSTTTQSYKKQPPKILSKQKDSSSKNNSSIQDEIAAKLKTVPITNNVSKNTQYKKVPPKIPPKPPKE